MLIGYVRASVADGFPQLQLDALQKAGCDRVFKDEGVNGGALKRPGLEAALRTLSRGDVLVIWKFDRLGRSLAHAVHLVERLASEGIGFSSLSDGIDTTAEGGPHITRVMNALAELDRSLITERTRAGQVEARKRGTKLGRKPKLSSVQVEHAQKLIDAGESPSQVARSIGVSPATLYRAIPAAASNRRTYDLFAGLNS